MEDAVLHVLQNTYSHLDKPCFCIRLMLFDFSNVFSTIHPHLFSEKQTLESKGQHPSHTLLS